MITSQNLKRLRKLGLLLVLPAAVATLGWGDTWEAIRSGGIRVQALRADFIQEKDMAMLAAPLVSEGRFLYRSPGSLRWEYVDPVRSILLMHGGVIRKYVEIDGQLVEDSTVRLDALPVVLEQMTGWLGGRFATDGPFDATLTSGRKIVLTPRQEGVARFVSKIELVLSDRPGVLEAVAIHENDAARTRIAFANVVVNPDLDMSRFERIE